MLSIQYSSYGEPAEVLAEATIPSLPAPLADQVLIRVQMRPIHPGDLLGVRGRYRSPGSNAGVGAGGAVPGFEGMGIVEALGPDVRRDRNLTVGQRVMFFPGRAAWSERVLVSASFVTGVPDDIPDQVACQLHVTALTAILLIRAAEQAGLRRKEDGVLLLTAAGSAVARLATLFALDRGLNVVNIVRSRDGAKVLRQRTSHVPVLSSDDSDWKKQLITMTDEKPIRVVLDPVGGTLAGELTELLSNGGTLVSYGDLSGEPMPVSALGFSVRNISIRGVSVGSWSGLPEEQRREDLAAAVALARREPAHFDTEAEYPLQHIVAAVKHAERPGKRGAVLLTS